MNKSDYKHKKTTNSEKDFLNVIKFDCEYTN